MHSTKYLVYNFNTVLLIAFKNATSKFRKYKTRIKRLHHRLHSFSDLTLDFTARINDNHAAPSRIVSLH